MASSYLALTTHIVHLGSTVMVAPGWTSKTPMFGGPGSR